MNEIESYEKLIAGRDAFLKKYHGVILYDYQRHFSDSLIKAVVMNEGTEISAIFSRQSGKTTAVVHTVEFLIYIYKMIFGKGIRIGIFAPQKEQAKTDFDRLKDAFDVLKSKGKQLNFKEANATTLKPETPLMESYKPATISIDQNNEIYAYPLSKTSHPESKTLDLIIIEEAQDVDDHRMINSVFPMGAATNATRVFIGTAGYSICYFYRQLQKSTEFMYPYEKIIESRQRMYEATNDEYHLNYKNYVLREKNSLGEDSDEFRTQYMLDWVLGAGQFITLEELTKLVGDNSRTYQDKSGKCFAGIDTAKMPDSTVVTVLRDEGNNKRKLLNWLELRGDNYQDQFDIIKDFLSHYDIKAVAIDSTGQGDFMPDMFERHTIWGDERSGLYRYKFSSSSKDILYKNLAVVCREFLTEIPKIETKEAEKFKQQMLDLQKEYKGEFLSCHHPDEPYAHDDYCFVKGTMVLTDKGQVSIEKIKIGDKVMTSNGLQQVIKTGSRMADVISRFGLTGTADHPFITKSGVKRFDKLDVSDIIYLWNEKQSSIEAVSITAILNQSTDSSEYITGLTQTGRSRQDHFTARYGKTILGRLSMVMSSTIKTGTQAIIRLKIWSVYLGQNTKQITEKLTKKLPNIILKNMLDQRRSSGTSQRNPKSFIANTPLKAFRETHKKLNALTAERVFSIPEKLVRSIAQRFVGRTTEKRVYNLTVNNNHNYFANSILVHNCDSWALAEYAYAEYNKSNYTNVLTIKGEEEKKRLNDFLGEFDDEFFN